MYFLKYTSGPHWGGCTRSDPHLGAAALCTSLRAYGPSIICPAKLLCIDDNFN